MLQNILKLYFFYAAAVIAIFFLGILYGWHSPYATGYIWYMFPRSFVVSLIIVLILFGRAAVRNADAGIQRAFAQRAARVNAIISLIFAALFTLIYFTAAPIAREYTKHFPQKSHNYYATIYENCRDCDYLDTDIYRYCMIADAGALLVASIFLHVAIASFVAKPGIKKEV